MKQRWILGPERWIISMDGSWDRSPQDLEERCKPFKQHQKEREMLEGGQLSGRSLAAIHLAAPSLHAIQSRRPSSIYIYHFGIRKGHGVPKQLQRVGKLVLKGERGGCIPGYPGMLFTFNRVWHWGFQYKLKELHHQFFQIAVSPDVSFSIVPFPWSMCFATYADDKAILVMSSHV